MAEKSFRRYTNLASAIDLLVTGQLTLLSPTAWDDRNDAYFMEQFKNQGGAENVFALCFTEREETYHHWKIYAGGTDGVCLQFDKEKLLENLCDNPNIRMGEVVYKQIKEAQRLTSIDINELPFLKRFPYGDEREYRIVCIEDQPTSGLPKFDVELDCLNRITLAPWMPMGLFESVKKVLKRVGGTDLEVSRSTLLENKTWKKIAGRVR
jgi:hypothetical protein